MPLKYHDFYTESLNTMRHLHLQKFCCSRKWALAFTAIAKSQLHFLMTMKAATSHAMLHQPKQLVDVPESVSDRRTTRALTRTVWGCTVTLPDHSSQQSIYFYFYVARSF